MTGIATPDAPETRREQHEGQKWALSDPSSVRRLAVLRALKLGDLLLAVPALQALRRRFAQAEITLISLPWASEFAARYHECVDRFVKFAGYPGIREAENAPLDEMERFLAEQRAYEYDLVIQMHGSGHVSNLCALAFDGRETAGYYDEHGAGRALSPYATPRLTYAEPYPYDEPEVMRNLGLARMLGCDNLDPTLEFPLMEADHAEAQMLLGVSAADDRPMVGIHAGASIPARRWPVERFAALADHLAQEWNARIVLTGGPDEIAIAQEVARHMETAGQTPLLVAGKTSLGGLAALLACHSSIMPSDILQYAYSSLLALCQAH